MRVLPSIARRLSSAGTYLLAAPSGPDEAREKAVEKAGDGEEITVAAAKKIVAEARKKTRPWTRKTIPADKLAGRLVSARERHRDRWDRKELAELARQLRDFAACRHNRATGVQHPTAKRPPLRPLGPGTSHPVTDGMSDAPYTAFDESGKYLYFTASTDIGPTLTGIDMSGMNRPVTRSVYLVVLDKTQPSPLAPESDEEKENPADPKEKAGVKEPADEMDKPVEKSGWRAAACGAVVLGPSGRSA
jgi:hypothetical protein